MAAVSAKLLLPFTTRRHADVNALEAATVGLQKACGSGLTTRHAVVSASTSLNALQDTIGIKRLATAIANPKHVFLGNSKAQNHVNAQKDVSKIRCAFLVKYGTLINANAFARRAKFALLLSHGMKTIANALNHAHL